MTTLVTVSEPLRCPSNPPQSAPDFGPPVSNDLPVPELQRPPRTHRPVPKQHSMASMHAEVPEALGGDTSMAVDPPAPLPQPAFINPPPPDLRQASAHLQTKGRFLEYSDVGTQLRRVPRVSWAHQLGWDETGELQEARPALPDAAGADWRSCTGRTTGTGTLSRSRTSTRRL